MALNINKEQMDYNYYYTKDDKQYGPFTLSRLIPEIEGDTLVWREGIDWTNANKLDELSRFFPDLKDNKVEIDNSITPNNDYSIIKQKMFATPFSFDGRIRRTEFVISFIIYIVAYFIVMGLTESSTMFGLGYIPLLWFLWAQGAKRCHDRGNSGWYQIIPFYALWMLFAEGDLGENEFGSSPK